MSDSTVFTQTLNTPFGLILEAQSDNVDINELSIPELRHYLDKHQLLVLRGFTTLTNPTALSQYSQRWGELSIWPFGTVLELVQHDSPQDHIFDHSYVPMHWDGMYRPQIPEIQVFQCVKAPPQQQGGQTVFSNTPDIIAKMPADLRALCHKLTATYWRKMEFYNSQVQSKLIVKHPYKNVDVIRYNEPHTTANGHLLNQPEMIFEGLDANDLLHVHQQLRQRLYAPQHSYAHNWQDNDIVIADNFTLLHARHSFTSHAPRHLRRVQVHSNPPLNNTQLTSHT